jgi:hypothetical protein
MAHRRGRESERAGSEELAETGVGRVSAAPRRFQSLPISGQMDTIFKKSFSTPWRVFPSVLAYVSEGSNGLPDKTMS